TDAQSNAIAAKLRAATTPGILLVPNGADIYASWQYTFARKIDHVDAKTLATSPYAAQITKMLKRISHCAEGTCTPASGGGEVHVTADGKIRSFVVHPPAERAPVHAEADDAALLLAFVHVE